MTGFYEIFGSKFTPCELPLSLLFCVIFLS